jgi:hypothetical protein
MTTAQIRKSGVSGRISMAYNSSANYLIQFSDGNFFCFETNRERQKVWNKLMKLGFARDLNLGSEESQGIAQATDAFNFKIISA